MSDYASFVTEPFWPDGPYMQVAVWFQEQCYECTEIKGDKGTVAFAGVLRDGSWDNCLDQARGIISDIADIFTDQWWLELQHRDFTISVIGTAAGEHELLSVKNWIREMALAKERGIERMRAEAESAERAERDRRATEGMVNPSLDAFLQRPGS